jgi:hypothetical protein
MTIWRMRIACCIQKATDTHSEYVTHCFSTATMVMRTRLNVNVVRTYVACLVFLSFIVDFLQGNSPASGLYVPTFHLHRHQPMKMELIEGSETSAYTNQAPGNYPKENLLHS